MSALANFLTAIGTPGPVAAGVAAQQTPPLDELVEASAERAEYAEAAEGIEVEPIYEPERPVISDTHLISVLQAVETVLLGSPPPDRLTVYRINRTAADCGLAVQVVPPSEGRKRRVLIECITGTAYLAPERRETGSPTAGDTTGFVLDDGTNFTGDEQIELMSTGALFATSTVAYDLRVLIEHYPDPAKR